MAGMKRAFYTKMPVDGSVSMIHQLEQLNDQLGNSDDQGHELAGTWALVVFFGDFLTSDESQGQSLTQIGSLSRSSLDQCASESAGRHADS